MNELEKINHLFFKLFIRIVKQRNEEIDKRRKLISLASKRLVWTTQMKLMKFGLKLSKLNSDYISTTPMHQEDSFQQRNNINSFLTSSD